MKKLVFLAIAFAIASITFISCNWFSSKPTVKQPSIIGKWKIDSVYTNSKDSNSLMLLAWALSKKEKDSIYIQFRPDSTYTENERTDSIRSTYSFNNQLLTLKQDTTTTIFSVTRLTDSTMVLDFMKDSSSILLSKMK